MRDCLRLYNPKHNTKQLKSDLNKCHKSTLVSALEYLDVYGYDSYTKPACITKLVCRIQNLLPDKCHICGDKYCIQLKDTPLLSCEICSQGSHNYCILNQLRIPSEDWEDYTADEALRACNPTDMPGFHYLCGECKSVTIPDKEAGMLKRKEKTSTGHVVAEDNRDGHSQEAQDPEDEDDEVSEPKGRDTVDSDSRELPQKKSTRICPFYRKGSCRHGQSGKECPDDHPRPCKKLLKHGNRGPAGCTMGSDKCSAFHPKMCPTLYKLANATTMNVNYDM